MRLKTIIALLVLTGAAELQAAPSPQRNSGLFGRKAIRGSSKWRPSTGLSFLSRMFGGSQKVINPGHTTMAQHFGDVVLRFNVTTVEEGRRLATAAEEMYLDVWSANQEHVDIRIAQDSLTYLLDMLPESLQGRYSPLIPDLAKAMWNTFPENRPAPPTKTSSTVEDESMPAIEESVFFQDYQPLDVIGTWMDFLASLHSEHVSVENIGKSYEGRSIRALRVGTRQGADRGARKTIFVNGGTHAREWIGVSTVNYLAYIFATHYGRDRVITKLVDEYDWIFVPSLNIDGYVYTWEHDRLWRKNRQATSVSYCKGIDLDRSFGYQWDETGKINSNPCADNYQGEAAFAAVEAKALADYAHNLTESRNADIKGFLDFHSYSQQILYPYTYSCSAFPPNIETLEELSLVLSKAIRTHSGEHYTSSSACEGSGFLGRGGASLSGSALDYFYRVMKSTYAFQIKLRDTGSYGFLLPKSNIVPTGKEAVELVKAFGMFISREDDMKLTHMKRRRR